MPMRVGNPNTFARVVRPGRPVLLRRLVSAVVVVLVLALSGCKDATTSPETTGTIEGQVLNDDTGQSIANAQVTTSPPTSAPVTSDDGRFRIENVATGDYSVTAKKSGFESQSVSVSVREDETTEVNLLLPPEEEGATVDATITNWWNDRVSADSVFVNVEYRVENPSSDSVAEYEVNFAAHSPNGIFHQQESGGPLQADETDVGSFRKFIRDEPADSVRIDEVWSPGG